ncbi:hypothetical protein ACHAWF_017733, partial [Thalassiosira exigua]
GKSQKSIAPGLSKIVETKKALYHAIAHCGDGKLTIIFSKQVASQTRDENTRNKTAPGEKPLPHEYLVMMQVFCSQTDIHLASSPTFRSHIALFFSWGVACAINGLHCYGCSTCIGAKDGPPQSLQHPNSTLGFLTADPNETAQLLIPPRS